MEYLRTGPRLLSRLACPLNSQGGVHVPILHRPQCLYVTARPSLALQMRRPSICGTHCDTHMLLLTTCTSQGGAGRRQGPAVVARANFTPTATAHTLHDARSVPIWRQMADGGCSAAQLTRLHCIGTYKGRLERAQLMPHA